MAKPKIRSVSMTVEFTMKRQGEAKGDEAWSAILKAIQRVLGEKYDVQRLIVSRDEEPPIHQPDDKVFESAWRKGEWESYYEWSGMLAEDQAREEAREAELEASMETPAQPLATTPPEGELAQQVEEEDAEAAIEEHDLEQIEAAEHMPDEPDPAA